MSSWAERAKVRFSQKGQNPTPKTAETPFLGVLGVPPEGFCENTDRVLGVLAVPSEAKPEKTHSDAPSRPACLSPKLHAASVELDQADTPPGNPDRWCWPASSAMNGSEIALFGKRVDLFFYRDLLLSEAERLADQLVIRDRDADTRRACFECAHLRDVGNGWRCNNYRQAGLTTREIGRDFAVLLQHCTGFVKAAL